MGQGSSRLRSAHNLCTLCHRVTMAGLIKTMWTCVGQLWLDHLTTIHEKAKSPQSPVTLVSLLGDRVGLIHALQPNTLPYRRQSIDQNPQYTSRPIDPPTSPPSHNPIPQSTSASLHSAPPPSPLNDPPPPLHSTTHHRQPQHTQQWKRLLTENATVDGHSSERFRFSGPVGRSRTGSDQHVIIPLPFHPVLL